MISLSDESIVFTFQTVCSCSRRSTKQKLSIWSVG